MTTILNTIVEDIRVNLEQRKAQTPISSLEQMAYFNRECYSLKKSILSKSGIIAEVKRKSPSAGIIHSDLKLESIVKHYEAIEASGISCLTNKTFFGGSLDDLLAIRELTELPILRKEFIIDEFQIFESKAYGADVILLIAEILTYEQALHFTILAQSLGLEVIMEFHQASELQKINDLVDIIGVNNRNLKIQQTDINQSFKMSEFLPSDKIRISESGIQSMDEVDQLRVAGYAGFLIGESLLKQSFQFQNQSL